ncbi:MAG: glycosyltransferase family 39 protein [Micropepsaceae bacterium]
MTRLRRTLGSNPFALLAAFIAVVTVLRVVVLMMTPLNLGPDEAQYWSWSLRPDFGYFSKPPLIAWLIGATTSACGSAEACIRISAPFIHATTSLFVFLAGKALYDQKTGIWSSLTYILIPGTSFSSLLITTDVPLLCFWSLALWAVAEARRDPAWKWHILLGVAIGFGLLAKYAMLYFLLGITIAYLPSSSDRAFLFTRKMLGAVCVAILVFSPNIIWNVAHGMATVRHTASNANWGSSKLFNIGNALEFIVAQAGIIGPVAAIVIVWGLIRRWTDRDTPDTLMLSLSLPIITIVALQAFISRANANWAAPAFVTLCILACAWAVRKSHIRLLGVNTALNASIGIVLGALAVSPAFVSAMGQENSVKRLRGWNEAGRTIITIASSAPFEAIMSDDREDMASLFYYTRTRSVPLRMWPSVSPGNEYEASYALSPDVASLVLFVTRKQDVSVITNSFASSERIGTIETRLDSKRTRIFYLYALRGPMTASTFPNFSNRPSTE